MNTLTILGRLTADPEMKTTNTGKTIANFTIAEGDTKDASGNKITNFHNCQAWESRANLIKQYFIKGKAILVTGELKTENWEKDGQKRSRQIVNVSSISFVPQDTAQPTQTLPNVSEQDINQAMVDMPF